MNVTIDYDLCMGEGTCAKICPEVFGYDDDKLLGVVKTAAVPSEYQERVSQAAEECGAQAITVEG